MSSSGGRDPFAIPDVGSIDLGKIYSVPKAPSGGREPDYIPYNKRGRDIMSRVSQNTGLFWLGGFVGGGLYGMKEGWEGAANTSSKVRFNSIMNSMSRRGAKGANALGVIAFAHTMFGWVADEQLELERWTGTELSVSAFAGFATGLIYKSTTTPRAALLAGCIGMGVSVVYGVGGSYVYGLLFKRGGGRY